MADQAGSEDEPITLILDWWHLSIRVRHIDGMMTMERPAHPTLSHAAIEARRLRHLLWNGYADEAWHALESIQSGRAGFSNSPIRYPGHIPKLWGNCSDLKTFIANSEAAIIDYSRRYLSKMPVASSAAEGCVDEIANTRMGKKQRMRWSSRCTQGRDGTSCNARRSAPSPSHVAP